MHGVKFPGHFLSSRIFIGETGIDKGQLACASRDRFPPSVPAELGREFLYLVLRESPPKMDIREKLVSASQSRRA
jgi:hypothetical protein